MTRRRAITSAGLVVRLLSDLDTCIIFSTTHENKLKHGLHTANTFGLLTRDIGINLVTGETFRGCFHASRVNHHMWHVMQGFGLYLVKKILSYSRIS